MSAATSDRRMDFFPRGGALLSLARVARSKTNPRLHIDREPLQELKNSIAQNGVLQPILVRPSGDAYEIIGGHRRFAAVLELAQEHPADERFATIPVSVREASDEEVQALQLAENLNRADLAPLDVALAAARAIDSGLTKEQLAEMLGWHPRKLYRYLQLAAAPAWLRAFASEVPVRQRRVHNGVGSVEQATAQSVDDVKVHPGLAFTDLLELVVLHNALQERDIAEMKSVGRADFRPRAERVTRKLASAAAAGQWTTARLRDAVKRAKQAPVARTSPGERPRSAAFTITHTTATIDLAGIKALAHREREAFADALTAALSAAGYVAVIRTEGE